MPFDNQGNMATLVFTRKGRRIKSIREILSRVCREAGLTDVVFHDLRTQLRPTFAELAWTP